MCSELQLRYLLLAEPPETVLLFITSFNFSGETFYNLPRILNT
jgi:hypothetical protein